MHQTMKAGILTFHASHNYGSMLQAYALQKVLAHMGVDSEIINFRSKVQKLLIPPPIRFCNPRSSLLKLIKEPNKTLVLCRKYQRFEHFLNYDLNVSRELETREEVAEFVATRNYDAIITGSDQIWNPGCWDFSTVYLCDFPFDGKRIAYAPSLGSHPEEITDSEWKAIVKLAGQYDALSTREVRGSELLNQRLGRDINVVVDPTLLLKAEDYEPITAPKQIDRPYILYYTPREAKGYFKSALELSKQLHKKIVVTQDFEEYNGHDNVIYKQDSGPKEFLSLIKHADYCIGNSFHLLAFSLIFHKEFMLLSREQDSRMLNILELLSLQERLQLPEEIPPIFENINYLKVDEMSTVFREQSIDWVKNVI